MTAVDPSLGTSKRRRDLNRASLTAAALTACMALSSIAILAEPDLRETTERYEIRGSTAKELNEQMKRLGPRKGDRVYDAYTKWKVAWTYAFVTREGKCAISSIDVYVDFTITLPQWNHSEVDADPGLVERWEQFLAAVEAHESEHRRLGLEAAIQVEQRVSGLEARTTCDGLDDAIHTAARGVIDGYRETERRFDEDTRHGKTAGARL